MNVFSSSGYRDKHFMKHVLCIFAVLSFTFQELATLQHSSKFPLVACEWQTDCCRCCRLNSFIIVISNNDRHCCVVVGDILFKQNRLIDLCSTDETYTSSTFLYFFPVTGTDEIKCRWCFINNSFSDNLDLLLWNICEKQDLNITYSIFEL